jgi:rod shape-determining protein MreC
MLKKTHYIAFTVVLALVLALLKLPDQTSARFKLAVSSLFLPLFGASTAVGRVADATGIAVQPKSYIVRQNEVFRKENADLRLLQQQANELLAENQRLRQSVGWQKQLPWKSRLGQVIARDPATWWHTIQIDLGSRDGVQLNMPVLTNQRPDGRIALVGKVTVVGESRSRVVLLGDPKLRVAALVQETRDQGVVGPGKGAALSTDFVELGYLSRNSILKPGQTVVTSGDGGLFPKGILIGTVVDSQSVDYGMSFDARVKLAADFGKLEEVWVIQP